MGTADSTVEPRLSLEVVVVVAMVAAALTAGLGLARLAFGVDPTVAVVLVAATFGFASAAVLAQVGSALSRVALPLSGLFGTTAMAMVEGGLYSEALPWMPFIPIVAALALGRGAAIGFTVLTIGAQALLLALHLSGWMHFDASQPVVTAQAPAVLVLRLSGAAGACWFGGFLGWSFERNRERTQQRLGQLANYSSVAGLPNRNLLLPALTTALARARRNDSAIGLLYLDLDGFKEVNDTYGHDRGDALLRAVADRVQSNCRESELPYHLSGDEFVVLLQDLDSPQDAVIPAERLRDAVGHPFEIDDLIIQVTSSVGAAFPSEHDGPSTLLRKADQAMYKAKRGGKNRVAGFTDPPLVS